MSLENYTVFCVVLDRQVTDTAWIQTIQATSKKEAMQIGIETCADDWEMEPADVVALGIVEGDINVLAWDDSGYSYGELTTAGFEV